MGSTRYEGVSREELIEELERRDRLRPKRNSDALLRETLERYADLYEFAPCGYVTLDSSGTVIDLNHTAAALLGSVKRAIGGMPLAHWVAPDDRRTLLEHLRAVRAAGGQVRVELMLEVTDSKRTLRAELISKVMPTAAFGPVVVRSILIDLTERDRMRAEEDALRVQKERAEAASEAKGRFLAMLSHELRTPLTPILAAASQLETRRDLPSDVLRILTMIRRNAEVEAGLIDDLLDLTRVERGKLRIASAVVDVHEVLHSVLSMCAHAIERKNLLLAMDLAAARPYVRGDSTRLHQIFWNLLSNAVRHTPVEGTIHVRTRADGDALAIIVADTGDGIDAEALPRLFTPFEQLGERSRRIGALGLGLAITRGLVEAHGGFIAARSDGRGRGTEFEVRLPPAAPSEAPSPKSTPSQPPVSDPAQVRILLVEDNPDTAELITLLLQTSGFTVKTAGSLREARELMSDDVSVVITDLGLPDGTGVDLVTEIRRTSAVPAIALTGYGSDFDMAETKAAGFSMHLTKPVRFDDLVRAIESVRK